MTGAMIRLPVPPLSEDRRRDLVKAARTRGEDAKVAVRNVRRHAKDHVKSTQNEENLPEDMRFEAEDTLQAMTDKNIGKVDSLLDTKRQKSWRYSAMPSLYARKIHRFLRSESETSIHRTHLERPEAGEVSRVAEGARLESGVCG